MLETLFVHCAWKCYFFLKCFSLIIINNNVTNFRNVSNVTQQTRSSSNVQSYLLILFSLKGYLRIELFSERSVVIGRTFYKCYSLFQNVQKTFKCIVPII